MFTATGVILLNVLNHLAAKEPDFHLCDNGSIMTFTPVDPNNPRKTGKLQHEARVTYRGRNFRVRR